MFLFSAFASHFGIFYRFIMLSPHPIRLTQFSHGAGCGCKISPTILSQILHNQEQFPEDAGLLVGNNSRDDAAVYDLGNGIGLIATTDFFMPIVDDPFDFGRIAAANAISDIYAMGGTPLMAIAILGWPLDKLPAEIAGRVIAGGRAMCAEAGIPLAGGHSIDSPEPIFGLAVNGIVPLANLKRNNTAQADDYIFLTKPLGTGILTTAEKKAILHNVDNGRAAASMRKLNKIGEKMGNSCGVTAMTDVTGFGLLGHLAEICEGSNVSAEITFSSIPIFDNLDFYIENKAIPSGSERNWQSYGSKIAEISYRERIILSDPQTSGGLLIAVRPEAADEVIHILKDNSLEQFTTPIGRVAESREKLIYVR